MASSSRLSSTANAVFTITSGLIVVGITLVATILLSGKYDYPTIKVDIDHKYRREDIKQFLFYNVGWNHQPAFLMSNPPILAEDDLPQVYEDLPGFASHLLFIEKAVHDCIANPSFDFVGAEARAF
jgi:hypothetical protein